MIKKFVIAAGSIATAAILLTAPASAGNLSFSGYYDSNNDRVVSSSYRDNRVNRNYRDYRDYRHNRNDRWNRRNRRNNMSPQRRHARILRNRGGMESWKVKRHLRRDHGFAHIRITDKLLPIYQFRACKNGKKFNVRTNRFGKVLSKNRIGRCGRRVRDNDYHYKGSRRSPRISIRTPYFDYNY